MPQMKVVILGSSSPFRRQVLDELKPELTYRVVTPDFDEKSFRHPDPVHLTLRLAKAKGMAVATKVNGPCVIISSDQVVSYQGEIREKPEHADEAVRWMRGYGRGEPITCVTAVCVSEIAADGSITQSEGCDLAYVDFHPLPDVAVLAAIRRGTVLQCSGALDISDPDLAVHMKGMWNLIGPSDARTSIIGLPRHLTLRLLRAHEVF